MPALDQWDTGYRSPDWYERDADERRLDYHYIAVGIAVTTLRNEIGRACRHMEDPAHHFDHVRNILALLIRQVSGSYGMSPDRMQSFALGLAAQAYREEQVRMFHSGSRK